MKAAALISLCAFLQAFLGCSQMVCMARGYRRLSALISCGIGFAQLHIYQLAQQVTGIGGEMAYVLAGLAGSQLALSLRKTTNQPNP